MKSLLKNESKKPFLLCKKRVSQRVFLLDMVKIRVMKYSSNCLLKIKGHILCVQNSLYQFVTMIEKMYLCLYGCVNCLLYQQETDEYF